MSKKGGNKKVKSLNTAKSVSLKRKERVWAIKTKAGPHRNESAVPLGIVLRDYSGIAKDLKEAKEMLNNGDVKVSGVVRKSHQFPVGLFDTVDLEKQKASYRLAFDKKARLVLKTLKKPSHEKISRVEYKIMTAKGIQLTTDDGRVLFGTDAKVGDSVLLKLPEGKVTKVLPLQNNAVVYVTRGVHCSAQGKVKSITPGTAKREKLVKFSTGKEELETVARNVYVIGENEVAIEDLKE